MHSLAYAYWAWFGKPAGDRRLYRLMRRERPVRIVEIGLGSLPRSIRLIRISQRFSPDSVIEYTGVDLFEARTEGVERFSIKEAHREFKATSARIRLAPGTPDRVLATWANSLAQTDLLLIGRDVAEETLAGAWFYVPRMLHEGSLVLRESTARGACAWSPLTPVEIASRATAKLVRKAA
jgi:hypothetical protein